MNTTALTIHVGDSSGDVSAISIIPDEMDFVMTLAHGAGAGMTHTFMEKLAVALAGHGIGTVRFNFPYMEHRRKRPDPPPVATRTIEAVIRWTMENFPQVKIVAAGKSFGGRMTSHLLCKHTFSQVKAIVFYGFPLHPAGKPSVDRAGHLRDVAMPMLFLQGTRDTLAQADLIESVVSSLPMANLELIQGADHSFKVGKTDSIVDLAKKTCDWLKSLHFQ